MKYLRRHIVEGCVCGGGACAGVCVKYTLTIPAACQSCSSIWACFMGSVQRLTWRFISSTPSSPRRLEEVKRSKWLSEVKEQLWCENMRKMFIFLRQSVFYLLNMMKHRAMCLWRNREQVKKVRYIFNYHHFYPDTSKSVWFLSSNQQKSIHPFSSQLQSYVTDLP